MVNSGPRHEHYELTVMRQRNAALDTEIQALRNQLADMQREIRSADDAVIELTQRHDDDISALRSDLEGQIERNESLVYEVRDQHEREYDHDAF